MKRIVIECQTGPGGKRRLAEEALRLAAGLAATGRFQVDFVLRKGGLLLLEPEFRGSPSSWESLQSDLTNVWIPPVSPPENSGLKLKILPGGDLETFARGADLVLSF